MRLCRAPLTSLLVTLLWGFYALGWRFRSFVAGTALIWSNTFMQGFFIWNLATGSFLETSPIKLLLSTAGLVFAGPMVEEGLGTLNMTLYVLIVAVACGVVTSAAIFFLYIVTRWEGLLSVEVHGFNGIMSAVLVAAVQQSSSSSAAGAPLQPESESNQKGRFCRYVPVVLAVTSGLCYFGGLRSIATDFPFACVGPYFGWAYLRFVHVFPSGQVGDTSEEFEFVSFFPSPVRRALKPLCDFLFGVALLLGFFEERTTRRVLQVGQQETAVAEVPRDPVAERRRARALSLLKEKMGSATGTGRSEAKMSPGKEQPRAGEEL